MCDFLLNSNVKKSIYITDFQLFKLIVLVHSNVLQKLKFYTLGKSLSSLSGRFECPIKYVSI